MLGQDNSVRLLITICIHYLKEGVDLNLSLILEKTGHVNHGTIQDKLGQVAVLFEDVDQMEPTEMDGPTKIRSVH